MDSIHKYGTINSGSSGNDVESGEASQQVSKKFYWNPCMIATIGSSVIAMTVVFLSLSTSGSTSALSTSSSRSTGKTTAEKAAFVATLKTVTSVTTYSQLQISEKEKLYEEYKIVHKRDYKKGSEEDAVRFTNFQTFLAKVDENNMREVKKGGAGKHGITKFADWSQDEMDKLLNFKPRSEKVKELAAVKKLKTAKASKSLPKTTSTTSTVTSVDWSGIYTTPVKDQGYCGSCWAFSATEQIESDSIRAGYLTTSDYLSEQQIVSCDTEMYGCDGGDTSYAYDYVISNGGIVSETTYPYSDDAYWEGTTDTCNTTEETTDMLVTVDSYSWLEDEEAMRDYVLTTGPVSICLAADTWYTYTGGILSSCDTDVDHCVQAVGINTDDGYWIVRNSWGTTWGLEGYIYLAYGENLCDLASYTTYTSVSQVSR